MRVSGHRNTIGGTDPGEGNLISGTEADHNLVIQGVSDALRAEDNSVIGNLIGTDINGTGNLGAASTTGIFIQHAADTLIGGVNPGEGNVISGIGNAVFGIATGIEVSDGATGTVIRGNRIGTDITGTVAVGNGVGVILNGPGSVLGGTTAGARNIIANSLAGVEVSGAGSMVQGNFFGTDITGTVAMPIGLDTIIINGDDITIGGSAPGAGNVIANGGQNTLNGHGIRLTNGDGVVIEGNTIGLDSTGLVAMGIAADGIHVSMATDLTIRSNVIANGGAAGIKLDAPGIDGVTIAGNLIGTDATGLAAMGNGGDGITVQGENVTIGGPDEADRNVIAASTFFGIAISTADGVTIQGNYVGTDATGMAELLNGYSAYSVFDPATTNVVVGGDDAGEGNLINGGANFRNAERVLGNLFGLNKDGDAVLTEADVNISGPGVVFGEAGAGNVVVGGGLIVNSLGDDAIIQGNKIGTDISGTVALGSFWSILVQNGADNVMIGGSGAGQGNLLSGATTHGISLGASVGATVQGNIIGLDATGTVVLGNGLSGISGGIDALIGGTAAGAGNVISGNSDHGIVVDNSGVTIQGNKIGTDITGTVALGNGADRAGIQLFNAPAAAGTVIGGSAAGAGNLISGNQDGVRIDFVDQVMIQGNLIGTDITGTSALGNTRAGVYIQNSDNTVIGGRAAGEGNVIAFNGEEGVVVLFSNPANTGNQIIGNSIFGNAKLGIDLSIFSNIGNGVTATDGGAPPDADAGANGLQNFPVLINALTGSLGVEGSLSSTPNTAFTIDVYANDALDPSGHGEGQTYVGSFDVMTNAAGVANFAHLFAAADVPAGKFITATATGPEGTSEFSLGVEAVVQPEIVVSGDGELIIAGDNTPDPADLTDFGRFLVDGQMVTHTFTIDNIGGEDLNLTGVPIVDITGAHPGDFAVSAQPGASNIPGAGSLDFMVTFDPTADGVRTATVSIANDDGDENPYTFAIQGEGFSRTPVAGIGDGQAGSKIQQVDDFGNSFEFQVSGGGTATIIREGNGRLSVDVTNPTAKTKLTIKPLAGDGTLHSINVLGGGLAAIIGKGVHIAGDVVVEGLAPTVTLGNIADQHELIFGGVATDKGIKLTFGNLTDVTLTSTAPIASLTTSQWLDTDPDVNLDLVTAPWIGTLASKIGDFEAGLQLSGAAAPRGVTLNKATIKRRLGSDDPANIAFWNITGDVNSITAGGVNGWLLNLMSSVKTLKLGWVESATITLDNGTIGKLDVTQWDEGSVTGGAIGKLTSKADRKTPGANGDFRASVTLTGSADPRVKGPLGKASIARHLGSGDAAAPVIWDLTGDVGSVDASKGTTEGLTFNVHSNISALKLGLVEQADVTIGDPDGNGLRGDAGTISATQWNQGTITGGSVKTLATKANNKVAGADGDFAAVLELTGSANPGIKQTLAKATIARHLLSDTWNITDDVGTIDASKGTINGWTLTVASDVKTMKLGRVTNATVHVDGNGGAVSAKEWLTGSYRADFMKSLKTTGDKKAGVAGSFGAALTLDGTADPKVKTVVASAKFTGDLGSGDAEDPVEWDITGNVGTIDASKGKTEGWALDLHSDVKTVKLGLVEQADLTIGDEAAGTGLRGDAGTISATQWNRGQIRAGSVKALSTKQNTKVPGANGDFRGDVELTGSANPKVKHTLAKASIAGGIIDAFFDILVGDIGAVSAALIDGSTIRAGIEQTVPVQWLPDDGANYTAARSRIGSFGLTGKGQPKGAPTFLNSVLAAWHLGKVKLGVVDTDAGGLAFGLAGHTIDAITGATETETLPKKPPFATTEFGDFKLQLV